MDGNSIYTDGSYLARTGGTWHLEDSAFKAKWIARMLAGHAALPPIASVCEIGCGAGGVLAELQKLLPAGVAFHGYEISPQAHQISKQFENDLCTYTLGDAFADPAVYDLVLLLDVVEHVEDCLGFIRRAGTKGRLKLYHIPLDAYASMILRGNHCWDSAGHLHLFTIETALKAIEYTGQRIIDWKLSNGALQAPRNIRTRISNLFRRPVALFSPKLAARLLGGYSMLILAE